ncbi:MAG: thiamine-phosphate kinase [Myxococcota bacterium]
MKREFERIEAIRQRLARRSPDVQVGIGDDAAVLTPGTGSPVLTVDAGVEGVHFRRDLCTLRDAGYRSFMAAASDLAAMGARPRAALLALILPRDLTDEDLLRLVDGVAEAAADAGSPVAGGNLSSGGELSITTTLVGEIDGPPMLRSGAGDGEGIYVTGHVGAAALGLALLEAGRAEDPDSNAQHCIRRWRRPMAALVAGQRLQGYATACVDISDGLLQDLNHLCQASGTGAELHTDQLPLPDGFDALAASLDADPLQIALGSGDDYELLFTAPSSETADGLATRIGHTTATPGITILDETGSPIDAPLTGYEHF